MSPAVNTVARIPPTTAVFFDVDFTLIYPGQAFQGEGYQAFCARHGIAADAARFPAAVLAAASILDRPASPQYEEGLFVRYTRTIIEGMGGTGASLDACAREMYAEWAACHHFHLYDDVKPTLQRLAREGYKVGLISNSHRCLDSFQSHFDLDGLIAGAISSSDHGYLKPHPSIFEAALARLGVPAGEAVMVGDSLSHDVEGARRVGMRGVLLRRVVGGSSFGGSAVQGGASGRGRSKVPVIGGLAELPSWL